MDPQEQSLTTASGRQLHLALTAASEEIFQLLLSTDQELLQTLLKNPEFNDEHLLSLLRRRDLPEFLLKSIYQRRCEKLSHKLILALVKNPATPGNITRSLLSRLRLFELVDLCFIPGGTPDQRLAAERVIIQRLPTTPLGNKLTLARRATAGVVAELLKEGDPRLLDACLNSPRLREAAIFQFLTGPRATAETISQIARHSRWNQRPNLRLAILKNRYTPNIWYTLWLPQLHTSLLRQLLASRRLTPGQKSLATQELRKRAGG